MQSATSCCAALRPGSVRCIHVRTRKKSNTDSPPLDLDRTGGERKSENRKLEHVNRENRKNRENRENRKF